MSNQQSHIRQPNRIHADYSISLPLPFVPKHKPNQFRIAVIVHIHYDEYAWEILSYLNNMPNYTDIFISTNAKIKIDRIKRVFSNYKFGNVEYRLFPNIGRDIAPKIVGFSDVYDRYDVVAHLHSKKSDHNTKLDTWRNYLFESLCGSRETIKDIIEIFSSNTDVGMIFPQHFEYVTRWIAWDDNFLEAQQLAQKMGYNLSETHPLDFPSGSMFWARTGALKRLLDVKLSFDDFPSEEGQQDGTLAHAVERMYAIVCELSGYRWIKIAKPNLLVRQDNLVIPKNRNELRDYIDKTPCLIKSANLPTEQKAWDPELGITDDLRKIRQKCQTLNEAGKNFSGWVKLPL